MNAQAEPAAPPRDPIVNAAIAAYGVIALLFLAMWLGNAPARWGAPYPLTNVEPQPIHALQSLREGRPLYTDYTKVRPIVPLTYGPLTYVVPGAVARLLPADAPVMSNAYIGRGFAIGGVLASWLFAALIAVQRGVPARFAAVAGSPLFLFPYMGEWYTKFTPDTTALALSLAGWWLMGPPHAGTPRYGRMAGALAIWLAAFLFKPTVLAGAFAFGIERLNAAASSGAKRTRFIEALASGGALVVGAAIAGAILQGVTGGLWYQNAVESMAAGSTSLGHIAASLGSFNESLLLNRMFGEVPAIFGGLGAILSMLAWSVWRARASALHAAAAFEAAFGVASLVKQGSNINYLIGAVLLWGVAMTVDVINHPPVRRRAALFLAPAMLLLALDLPRARVFSFETVPPAESEFAEAAALVRSLPAGSVLVLDGNIAASEGLEALWADGFHASTLEEAGVLSVAPEMQGIAGRRYRLIITNLFHITNAKYHDLPLFPARMGRAIKDNYVLVKRGNWLALWAPMPPREMLPGEGAP